MKQAFFMVMPWKWEIGIFHGGTAADFAAVLKREFDEDLGDISGSQGFCCRKPGQPVLVWVHSLKDTPTLVHELMHATFGIVSGRGVTYSGDSEEAYTYTLENILRQIQAQKTWKNA